MTSAIHNLDKLLLTHDSLARVRSQLLAAEKASGIGDLHTNTIRILQKGGARLVHAQAHLGEVIAFALSPNQRHLATGSWVSDDYERGGMLQIWDIEMGRCVNVLDPIEGGIGWPDYPNCIAWSTDSSRLAMAYNTNSFGLFDPFGERPIALIGADVTDGWSRPPAFCLMPDGQHAFIGCWRDAKIPGVYLEWKEKPSKRSSKVGSPSKIKAMGEEIPKELREKLENGHLEPPKVIIPSPDGSKVHCLNSHGFAYTITLANGHLDYITKVGLPAAFSADGRFLAHTLAGLVIYDGKTGLPTLNLPMHLGMNSLHWSKLGDTARLAGVVSEDNDFSAEPGVHIYDDGTYRYSIDVKPRNPSWDDCDFKAFAWSTSGKRAAVLDESGKLQIVSLEDAVKVERVIALDEEIRGIFWASPEGSSREIIIAAHRECVMFIDANTGEIYAEHSFRKAPEAPRPLDTGEMDLADLLRPDPTFAIDEETWGAAFPEGLVIAPADKKDKLDAHLAWSVNRRFALPVRWGGLEVVESAAAVNKSEIKPAGVNWKKFKPAKSRKQAPAFPPPNPANLGPMYDAVAESMGDLGRGWLSHIAENLQHAAIFRARRGEISEALVMADKIPAYPEMLYTKAYITAIAYRAGKGSLVDSEFSFVVEEVESEITPHNEIFYAMALFAAWSAKKNQSKANEWLDRAKAKLEPENNAWQNRLALIWNLVEAGRLDEARALFTEKAPWVSEPLCFYSLPFAAAMVREGHYPILAEFLAQWNANRLGDIDWTLRDKLGQLLAHHGLVKELQEGHEQFDLVVAEDRLELAKKREKTGAILPSPSAEDIEALKADFAQLQKIPRARRASSSRNLIQKAARMGHSGAVITLLADLPATNFNDRPQAALSALWTLTTAFDIVPW